MKPSTKTDQPTTRSAMILAAGRGQRMRPLTDSCPKPLLQVNNKPLLDYHLQRLAEAGITNVVINVSWLAEKIQAHVGDGSRFGLHVQYSSEIEALETAGGIVQALPLLSATGDQEFLLLNADVYCDNPLPQLAQARLGKDLGRLLLTPTPDYLGGDFQLQGDRVIAKSESAGDIKAVPPYTYCGLARYSTEMFATLSAGQRPMLPVLQQAIKAGRLGGELLQGRWLDVGTPERLTQASTLGGPIT